MGLSAPSVVPTRCVCRRWHDDGGRLPHVPCRLGRALEQKGPGRGRGGRASSAWSQEEPRLGGEGRSPSPRGIGPWGRGHPPSAESMLHLRRHTPPGRAIAPPPRGSGAYLVRVDALVRLHGAAQQREVQHLQEAGADGVVRDAHADLLPLPGLLMGLVLHPHLSPEPRERARGSPPEATPGA